jgi:Ca-activated chloride channel family protein
MHVLNTLDCGNLRCWLLRVFISFIVGALTPFLVVAQAVEKYEESLPPTFAVGVELVTVGVQVTDRKGTHVEGLRKNDFLLYEDGVPQSISFFVEQEQPISMGVLLDQSRSMKGGKFDCVKRAALTFLSQAPQSSEFLFISFDHRVQKVCEFTTSAGEVKCFVQATEESAGGTSLYDAIVAALEQFSHAHHPRQALLVITDGADQHSRTPLAEVVHRLQGSMVQLHLVGYFSSFESDLFSESGETVELIDGSEIDNPRVVFDRLSRDSGARAWFPESDNELQVAARQISTDLRSQYALAYYPPDQSDSNKYRRIKVRVFRKGVNVRARHGYRLER